MQYSRTAEVTLQHFGRDFERTCQGWAKIFAACRLAHLHGFSWMWIDSCCIDKTSSVELAEVINSTFKWYAQAEICYAFVDTAQERSADMTTQRWFPRGWTLQELIAPAILQFYDSNLEHVVGSRESYASTILDATGVPETLLKPRPPASKHLLTGTWVERVRGKVVEALLLGLDDRHLRRYISNVLAAGIRGIYTLALMLV